MRKRYLRAVRRSRSVTDKLVECVCRICGVRVPMYAAVYDLEWVRQRSPRRTGHQPYDGPRKLVAVFCNACCEHASKVRSPDGPTLEAVMFAMVCELERAENAARASPEGTS